MVFMTARTSPSMGGGKARDLHASGVPASNCSAARQSADIETTARLPLRQRSQSTPPSSIPNAIRLPPSTPPPHSAHRTSAGAWPTSLSMANSVCVTRARTCPSVRSFVGVS